MPTGILRRPVRSFYDVLRRLGASEQESFGLDNTSSRVGNVPIQLPPRPEPHLTRAD